MFDHSTTLAKISLKMVPYGHIDMKFLQEQDSQSGHIYRCVVFLHIKSLSYRGPPSFIMTEYKINMEYEVFSILQFFLGFSHNPLQLARSARRLFLEAPVSTPHFWASTMQKERKGRRRAKGIQHW